MSSSVLIARLFSDPEVTAHLPRNGLRQLIFSIQSHMERLQALGLLLPCEFPLRHFFAPGSYGREMTLPAQSFIVGKIHKHSHLNIISKGSVAVLTEDGLQYFQAPYTFISSPGTKRVVAALEETIWTTIHATTSTDLAEIEADIIAQDYTQIEYSMTTGDCLLGEIQ